MNCDDVFDLLTSAEAASAVHATEAQQHLAGCAACRRLAAAVRPAVALLQTSIVAGDHHAVPVGPWTNPSAEAVIPLHLLTGTTPPRRRRKWSAALWPTAAAVLVGVALGGVVQRWIGGQAGGGDASLALGPRDRSPIEVTFDTERFDGRLRLVAACVSHALPQADVPQGESPHPLRLSDLACCTRCHHAGAAGMSPLAVLDVASSCRFCHTP